MKQGSRNDRLEKVRRQFERWRKIRLRGTRIPEELWQAATEEGEAEIVSSRRSSERGVNACFAKEPPHHAAAPCE